MPTAQCLTFLSDFGTRESYVAAVKGVILSACPGLNIVDITHEVRSHDLLEAAFTLSCAYSYFPSTTVHLVVVDPGVGSNRRGIVATSLHHVFVAPDNGVLSLVFEQAGVNHVYSIEAEHYYNQPVSSTFHGRDVFGPVAAQLARGVEADRFGPEIVDYVRLNLPSPTRTADREAEGLVLHIDRFGNVITSFKPADLERLFGSEARPQGFSLNGKRSGKHCQYYAEASEGELISVVGGTGYFELAALKRPAAALLDAKRGQKVVVSV